MYQVVDADSDDEVPDLVDGAAAEGAEADDVSDAILNLSIIFKTAAFSKLYCIKNLYWYVTDFVTM